VSSQAPYLMAVQTGPAGPEDDAAYNEWYDTVHIPQIMAAIPEVIGVQRYRMAPWQNGAQATELPLLTLYELSIPTDQALAIFERVIPTLDAYPLSKRAPTVTLYDAAAHHQR
jgi:hypothetical protein